MNALAKEFLQEKQIAVVGASSNPQKFGYAALTELAKRDYQVFPVNPSVDAIEGHPCYPSLAALKGKVTAVWMGVKPDQGAQVLREAAEIGVKKVWIQAGSETPELEALGTELGLSMVIRRCLLMYAEPVKSFHGFHRFFCKLAGQY